MPVVVGRARFSLWEPGQVTVTAGADSIGTFAKTPVSERKWCIKCGGHVMTNHPPFGLVDVYAATIPASPPAGAARVLFGKGALPIKDGLPKFSDFPEAFGGSGAMLEE